MVVFSQAHLLMISSLWITFWPPAEPGSEKSRKDWNNLLDGIFGQCRSCEKIIYGFMVDEKVLDPFKRQFAHITQEERFCHPVLQHITRMFKHSSCFLCQYLQQDGLTLGTEPFSSCFQGYRNPKTAKIRRWATAVWIYCSLIKNQIGATEDSFIKAWSDGVMYSVLL